MTPGRVKTYWTVSLFKGGDAKKRDGSFTNYLH